MLISMLSALEMAFIQYLEHYISAIIIIIIINYFGCIWHILFIFPIIPYYLA